MVTPLIYLVYESDLVFYTRLVELLNRMMIVVEGGGGLVNGLNRADNVDRESDDLLV